MFCDVCSAEMRPLLIGLFCPNDCDKRPMPVETHYGIDSRQVFLQSQLWRPNGPRCRVLCCPLCDERDIRLVCGKESNEHYDATCRGSGNLYHSIVVRNDEEH